MSRALSSICLVLLAWFGGTAWADKPKIAVLGLEVVAGPGGVVDATTTQIAKDITKELRVRAQAPTSRFAIAPNSNKELTDEKLLMSCDNEAKECMSVIGAGLAADMLLYGRVEKKGELYRVQLKLLDVKAKTVESGSDEMLAGVSPAGVARRLYSKLIGEAVAAQGTIVVVARGAGPSIDGAKVMVDDEPHGTLAGGKATLAGVGEGRHTVAIEAPGYRRFEQAVTVRANQTAALDASLVERGAGKGSNTAWKVAFGGGTVLAVGGIGLGIYAVVKVNNNKGEFIPAKMPGTNVDYTEGLRAPDNSDCGKTDDEIAMAKHTALKDRGVFDTACTWNKRLPIAFVVGGIGAAVAVTSLIMLTRDAPSDKVAQRRREPSIAVVPTMTTDSAGAAMLMRW